MLSQSSQSFVTGLLLALLQLVAAATDGGQFDHAIIAEPTSSGVDVVSEYGRAVAIDLPLLVVGADGSTVNGEDAAGAAFVYLCSTYDQCVLTSTLVDLGGDDIDYFGAEVAVVGTLVAVSAWGYNRRDGAVLLANCPAGVCGLLSRVEIGVSFADFGSSLAFQPGPQGYLLVVGARGDGAVYVFSCASYYTCEETQVLEAPSQGIGSSGFAEALAFDSSTGLLAVNSIYWNGPIGSGIEYVGAISTYLCDDFSGTCTAGAFLTGLEQSEYFGKTVTVTGWILLAGSGFERVTMYDCSAVSYCSFLTTLTAFDSSQPADIAFGSESVGMTTTGIVVVSAVLYSGSRYSSGAAYSFDCSALLASNASSCVTGTVLTSDNVDGSDSFQMGQPIAIGAGSIVLLGAPWQSVGGFVALYNLTSAATCACDAENGYTGLYCNVCQPEHFFELADGSACAACNASCFTCTGSASTCTSCDSTGPSPYLLDSFCVSACPQLLQNGSCVSYCSAPYNYMANVECVEVCPSDLPVLANGTVCSSVAEPEDEDDVDAGGSLESWQIALIVLGCLVATAAVGSVVYFVWIKPKPQYEMITN